MTATARPGTSSARGHLPIASKDDGQDESQLEDPELELDALEHSDDDDEDRKLERIRFDLATAKTRPMLEQAAKDFAIWKQAQVEKKNLLK